MGEPDYALSDADVDDYENRDDTWEDDWGDVEGEACVSLFSAEVLPSMAACCQHDSDNFGFDFRTFRSQRGLDDHDTIKCINYIRATVAAGGDPLPVLLQGGTPYNDDQYFRPVLEDDALLFQDFSEAANAEEGVEAEPTVAELLAENEALRECIELLKLQGVPEELRLESVSAAAAAPTPNHASTSHPTKSSQPTPAPTPTGPVIAAAARTLAPTVAASTRTPVTTSDSLAAAAGTSSSSRGDRVDQQYFDSYSYFDIHREMISDRVRTNAYRDALENNPALLRGATVLDVGCGTGILSMFAARGGAARVIAIDGSKRIAGFAEKNAVRAGLSHTTGGPITVVTGKVEELESIPVADKSVDVLVSEWMGYALLFESMLDSVLYARDRWLRPGGAMLPDRAIIYAAAGAEGATTLPFWDDVYGFAMPDIKADILACSTGEPLVAPVEERHLLSRPVAVKEFDLVTMARSDVDFSSEFEVCASAGGACHCVVLWFDTPFSERFCAEHPVNLSTSPRNSLTHWAQTVLLLQEPVQLVQGDRLAGRLSFAASDHHRSLDISLEITLVRADGSRGNTATSTFVMEVSPA